MRISHIAPVILPIPPEDYGGTERVIFDLAMEQKRLGHEVTIYGCRSSLVPVELAGNFQCLHNYAEAENVSVAQLPPGIVGAIEARQMSAICRDAENYDIIHLHSGMGFTGALAQCSTPVIRTLHWRTDEPDHQYFFDSFPEQALVAISQSQSQCVPKNQLVSTIYHGIDPKRYSDGNGGEDYLVFLGRMSDQKRPDRAIEMACATGKKLLLAGDIDVGNPGYFQEYVEPRLNDDIQYIGPVSDKDKQDLLGKALGLLFPIDWPEPFGLVMIEAMATGTPVIGWNNGSVPEVIDDGVSGYIVNDLQTAATAVSKLGQLSRTRVRQCFDAKFKRSRMAAEYEIAYQKLLRR